MRNTKEQLSEDVRAISRMAVERGYMIQPLDFFALGYMAAKCGLERLIDNQDAVIEACKKYDETDDLALLDTIGETLIDHKIIDNSKGEL